MKMGDGNREEPGRKVPQKIHRRWPARAQVRVKWWGKSPPRLGQPTRHGKPHAVQDRTGEGRPARSHPRVIVALRASGALRSGGVREMTVQSRASGRDRIRLTGERHSFLRMAAGRGLGKLPLQDQHGIGDQRHQHGTSPAANIFCGSDAGRVNAGFRRA